MRVAVIGAGIIGYAVAYELASRGAQVTVLDSRGAGAGATAASAGVLAPYIEGHFADLLKLTTCSLSGYQRFVERVAHDSGRPIEWRRSGTLQVARDADQAAQLAAAAASLDQSGVPHDLLDGGAAHRLEPALGRDVVAALRVASHAYVNVDQLMSALQTASDRLGVVASTQSVERIGRHGDGVRLRGSAEFDAEAVVLAAGSWSGRVEVTAAAAAPVKPIRGQRLHLRCQAPPAGHVVWGADCYLVPWQDGSVLVGATVEDAGFDESSTAEGVRNLLASAMALLPVLERARFESVRVGLRPRTPDELPIIGASPTMRGTYYATGHYRNGVLLAPLTATLIADLVLEGRERTDLAFIRPDRFGL